MIYKFHSTNKYTNITHVLNDLIVTYIIVHVHSDFLHF